MELVRRAYDAVNRRDIAAIEAIWAEDCVFYSVFAASEGRVFRGRQGVRDFFAAIDEAFDEYRIEPERILDAGDDRIVALTRITARGKASGIPIEQPVGQIWTVKGKEVRRVDGFADPAQALEAAGLQE